MVSAALTDWTGPRQARIQELREAHAQMGGTGRGRRWRTEQLNWALILRVAAEFQGFSRSLHDEGGDYFVMHASGLNVQLQPVLRASLTSGRKLDSGNAQPGSLGSDFGRFGIQFWTALKVRYPVRAPQWNARLEALNDARNAIAHDDQPKMAELAADGLPLSRLSTSEAFRSGVAGLAVGMDTVVGDYLQRLLGGPKPW